MQNTRSRPHLNRRNVVLAAFGAAPLLALATTGAQAKMAQTAVGYQQTPKDGKLGAASVGIIGMPLTPSRTVKPAFWSTFISRSAERYSSSPSSA